MIAPAAAFSPGIEYQELRGGRYRFVTNLNVSIRLRLPLQALILFRDKRGCERARFVGDKFRIAAGYAWNGCSPKRWIAGLGWVGTPDPEATRLASLVHDAFYQFLRTPHFPLSREQCDTVFLELLRLHRFPLASLYHRAVRGFGGIAASIAPNGETSHLISPLPHPAKP